MMGCWVCETGSWLAADDQLAPGNSTKSTAGREDQVWPGRCVGSCAEPKRCDILELVSLNRLDEGRLEQVESVKLSLVLVTRPEYGGTQTTSVQSKQKL